MEITRASKKNKGGSLMKNEHSGLTKSEIYGNVFVFSIAAHDTTAHALTFTIHFLAAYPEVQDWMREEL